MSGLIEELKRRNVLRVGAAYIVIAWLIAQVAELALDSFEAPGWVIKTILLVLALGLPVALFFAWAFELTPDGIKKEKDVDRSRSIAPQTGRKLDFTIIGILLLVIVFMGAERLLFAGNDGDTATATTTAPAGEDAQSDAAPNSAPDGVSDKTIAVLPFADLSPDQDKEWFADGLSEEILNALAKTPDLLVASRTSAFRYKDSDMDLVDIAGELGVAHVLEGSVRSAPDRIRVTAQLIRASDGFHIWSETYDRDLSDMIGIQEDVAISIAKTLQTTMDPEALATMYDVGTQSVAAYEAYLRGLAGVNQQFGSARADASYLDTVRHFEEARRIDPEFAAAYYQEADFWLSQLTTSDVRSGATDLPLGTLLSNYGNALDQAIQVTESNIDRAGYLAQKARFDSRFRDAMGYFREYLAERPNDQTARRGYFDVAVLLGDYGRAREIHDEFGERASADQLAANAYINLAFQLDRQRDVIEVGRRALQRWPRSSGLLYQVHRNLLWAGQTREAAEVLQQFVRLEGSADPLMAVRQHCAEGDRAKALAVAQTLDTEDPSLRALRWLAYLTLGDTEKANAVMREIASGGVQFQIVDYLTYPQFDPAPFPEIIAVMEREGVTRAPPREIPFACQPDQDTPVAALQ